MGKRLEIHDMPPLTVQMHNELNGMATRLKMALYACGDLRHYDEPRAFETLRTYAVELFNIYYGFYSQFPKYKRRWFGESQKRATSDALNCISSAYATDLAKLGYYWDRIFATIAERFNDSPAQPSQRKPSTSASDRRALWNAYQSEFPETKRLDVCWAARQHYREWKRWLALELKDGSLPDRSFRKVLTGGKPTSELRREKRPSGWQ